MTLRAAILLAALLPSGGRAPNQVFDADAIEREFEKFSKGYARKYTPDERRTRRAEFEANLRFIQAENSKGSSFELGLNGHADLSHAEFLATRLGLAVANGSRPWAGLPHLGIMAASGSSLPASVDWRKRGALTPVRNQGSCGACWTFSATGALSAAWQIQTGELVALSEQQLLDCTGDGTTGCTGGAMQPAFAYAERAGLCTAASYPYEGRQGACSASAYCSVAIPRGSVLGYRDVRPDSEVALMEAVAQQPVSAGIEGRSRTFRFYRAGVLSRGCGEAPNHAVLLVGYGKQGSTGMPYWLLKNSWGEDWGEDGYFKLLRQDHGVGACGVMTMPSYPVVLGHRRPTTRPSTTLPTSTTGAAGGARDYGQPPCSEDETLARVLGGEVCAPRCGPGGACPSGGAAAARPRCALQDPSFWGWALGRRYCALVCHASSECPRGALCRGRGHTGVCVYPEESRLGGVLGAVPNTAAPRPGGPRRLSLVEAEVASGVFV